MQRNEKKSHLMKIFSLFWLKRNDDQRMKTIDEFQLTWSLVSTNLTGRCARRHWYRLGVFRWGVTGRDSPLVSMVSVAETRWWHWLAVLLSDVVFVDDDKRYWLVSCSTDADESADGLACVTVNIGKYFFAKMISINLDEQIHLTFLLRLPVLRFDLVDEESVFSAWKNIDLRLNRFEILFELLSRISMVVVQVLSFSHCRCYSYWSMIRFDLVFFVWDVVF